MSFSGRVQDATNLLDSSVGKILVQWSEELGDQTRETQEDQQQDTLIVDNIQLIGDTVYDSSCRCTQNTGLC